MRTTQPVGVCAPGRNRTDDLPFRRGTLYPTELQGPAAATEFLPRAEHAQLTRSSGRDEKPVGGWAVLVIEDGRIVQRGTHDELLAIGGRYEELHRTQFAVQKNVAVDEEPEALSQV